MRHALTAQGYGLRLRPVRLDDAAFIVWLRNLDYVKGRVGDSATDVASQARWLKSYFEKEGDYYFIVETLKGIPLGTGGIYSVIGTCAEHGRFVLRPGVLAAVAATLLILDLAYGQMGMAQLRVASVASSHKVHTYIRKLGFRQVKVERAGRTIGGQAIDMVHFVQTIEDWFQARERIIPAARRAETWIQAWERAHFQNHTSQAPVTES